MNTIPIYSTCYGLKNTITEDIIFRRKNGGFLYAEQIDNFYIGDNGKIRPRFGTEAIGLSMDIISACRIESGVLFLCGGNLYKASSYFRNPVLVATDLNETLPISFETIDGITYYSNGIQQGKFDGTECCAWEKTDPALYTGSTTLDSPPAGSVLEHFNGRLYIASSNILWFTEPISYSLIDLASNFIMFDSVITDVCATDNGLFVIAGNQLHFLAGKSPATFTKTLISSDVVSGSLAYMKDFNTRIGSDLTSSSDTKMKSGVFFATVNGLIFCDDTGETQNIFNTACFGDDYNENASSAICNGVYYIKFTDGNSYCYNTNFGSAVRLLEENRIKYFVVDNRLFEFREDDVYVMMDYPDTTCEAKVVFPNNLYEGNNTKKPRMVLIECTGTGSFSLTLTAGDISVTRTLAIPSSKTLIKTFIPRTLYGTNFSVTVEKFANSSLYLSKISAIANTSTVR